MNPANIYNGLNYTTKEINRTFKIKVHNCVTHEISERYTDSELKEVLKQLKLKANF